MKITLFSKKMTFRVVSLFTCLLLDAYILSIIPETVGYSILFSIGAALQFYSCIELSNQLPDTFIEFDFRSEFKKQKDRERFDELHLEGIKNNLIQQIEYGKISREEAENRLESIMLIKQIYTLELPETV